MKRFISALLAIIILFSSFAGLNVFSSAKDVLKSSGYCGEQAGTKYDFDSSTGHLFIYGGGIIRSYAFFEHYEIKSIVIGHGVTGINESAFSNCKGLISLTLPNTLKSIGKWAFDDCTSLTKLAIPDSVTNIDIAAFHGCSALRELFIPVSVSLNYDDYWMSPFNGCKIDTITITKGTGKMFDYRSNTSSHTPWYTSRNNIKKLILENGIKNIGDYAFSGCDFLTKIAIPDSVTKIGGYAFNKCSKLSNFSVSDYVTSIGSHAFSGCSGLTQADIGVSVTKIPDYAFYYCTSLSNITIPDSVTEIGNKAFYGCNELFGITIPDSVTTINSNAFDNNLKTIYGKKGSAAEDFAKQKGITFVETEIIHQHKFINSEIIFESTCTSAGKEKRICRCGDSYTQALPLSPHNYKSCRVIQKATPSKQGKITTSTCSVCGNEGETQPIFSPKEIVLSANSFTYSAKQCKPAVTVKDSAGNVIDKSNYTIAYSNNINAGTAKVTVTFKGEYYEGSMSKTFKILPKKLTNCYLDNTFTYTGKTITPVPYYYKTVVQTFGGEQYTEKALTYFKKGTEYTIAVSGKHTQVGTYTVVIRFCGNYTGTVKKSIQIRPKPVTKSNIKPDSETSVKVSWNKVAGVSGYSVFRYNIQKNKWVRYKNTTATSMIVPRINASYTDVWLRIWTYQKIGGKVYYNESRRVHYTSEYTKPGKPTVKLVNTDFGNFVIKFNRVAWHQTQLSDNKAFSNKGNNICVTYRNYNEKVTATGWGSAKKYYVRSREYFYDNNNKLVVGPWSDIKTITTY